MREGIFEARTSSRGKQTRQSSGKAVGEVRYKLMFENMAYIILEDYANSYSKADKDTLARYLQKTFNDYLITNCVTMNEWIRVEDGLPEIDENSKGKYGGKKSVRVICACKQRDGKTFAKEGYYELRDDGDIFWRIPGTIDSVTHWRPLPELPKEIVE